MTWNYACFSPSVIGKITFSSGGQFSFCKYLKLSSLKDTFEKDFISNTFIVFTHLHSLGTFGELSVTKGDHKKT